MKYIPAIMIFLLACFFIYQQGRISVDNERVGFMLLRGGYRVWWVRYSEGLLLTRPPKNLWCWPRFEHCDVRPLMNRLKRDKPKQGISNTSQINSGGGLKGQGCIKRRRKAESLTSTNSTNKTSKACPGLLRLDLF